MSTLTIYFLPFFILLLLQLPHTSHAYDNDDYEIFDLYEEVNGTFYELLGVPQDASTAKIRSAYRKMSVKLHPDKNKAENAEEQFRQLVAVAEVLKDKTKREKYENVLKNGLPDWRNPIYYYRKYRKMGNAEVSFIVALIATIGHYLVWWVAYLEKKFEIEEILAPTRKRNEKKKAKGKNVDENAELSTEEILKKELGYRRPTMLDLLPFVIIKSFYSFFKSLPSKLKEAKKKREEENHRKAEEERLAAEMAEIAKQPKPKKVKQKIELRDASEFEHEQAMQWDMDNEDSANESVKASVKKGEWDEDDYAALAKLMAKFPGGTPLRWDRIAHELGRSKDDITKTVKSMKQSLSSHQTIESVYGNSDGLILKKKKQYNVSDDQITKSIFEEVKKTELATGDDMYQSQYDVPDDYDQGFSPPENEEQEIDYTIVKKKVKTRPVEEKKDEQQDENIAEKELEEEWSQVQQKCLEAAIAQFPKSTSERWTCIARAVPNKNKEQCITRYKFIAEQVKQRKMKKEKGS